MVLEWLEKKNRLQPTTVGGFCIEVGGDNGSRVYKMPWPGTDIAYTCTYGYSWARDVPILFAAGDNVSYRAVRSSAGTVLIMGEDVLKQEIYASVYDTTGKKSNRLRVILHDPYDEDTGGPAAEQPEAPPVLPP